MYPYDQQPQQPFQDQGYVQNYYHNTNNDLTPGIGTWIFSIILMSIPLVNLIYYIILLCGGSQYKAKVNLARATFVLLLIGIGLCLLLKDIIIQWLLSNM